MKKNSEIAWIRRCFDVLPGGILILDQRFKVQWVNKVFQGLMNIAKNEYGSYDHALDEFVKACKVNGNRDRWLMRIFNEDQSVLPITVIPMRNLESIALDSNSDIKTLRIYFVWIEDAALMKASLPSVKLYGQLRVDTEAARITYKRKTIHLTAKEFDLFMLFCEFQDKVLSRKVIRGRIWENMHVNDRAVDVLVARLKNKLMQLGISQTIISTVHGRGYLFDPAKITIR